MFIVEWNVAFIFPKSHSLKAYNLFLTLVTRVNEQNLPIISAGANNRQILLLPVIFFYPLLDVLE